MGASPSPLVLLPPAWCLRNEGVSSVLLGASSADQLLENIGAIQVSRGPAGCQARGPTRDLSGRDLLSTCYVLGTGLRQPATHSPALEELVF